MQAQPGGPRPRAATTRRLERDFFARPALEVAADLLGKLLVGDGLLARIVETEAYTEDEPASHAYRGRTARNAVLFGRPGLLYVYFTYGMHFCANAVTGPEGRGEAVLVRAAEPLAGLAVMRVRRAARTGRPVADRDLLRGPARLCQAFALARTADGTDLCTGRDSAEAAPVHLVDDGTHLPWASTARTGVALAADLPWRFAVPDSTWVSPYTRHPRALQGATDHSEG